MRDGCATRELFVGVTVFSIGANTDKALRETSGGVCANPQLSLKGFGTPRYGNS
jgi:hypothetical protein